MTPDRDALYQAVCSHPDEDTPRLAFADLVDELGDPDSGRFIRTQVELARVPEYDPLWVKCRQFDPGAILGWAMAHTLPVVPPGFHWYPHAFRRGFPWLVGVRDPAAFVDHLPGLFAAAPVQAVGLHGDNRPDTTALANSPHLGRLRRLEFSHARFDADDLTALGHSPHAAGLTELAFEHGGIDAGGLQSLVGSPLFPRLSVLELRANAIPSEWLVDALGAVREPGELRILALPFNRIPAADAPHLFRLPVVQGVTHLDLSDNPLNSDGVTALAESGVVRGLRVLKLTKTLPGVPGVRRLAEAGGLAAVRWLDLSANRFGPNAVRVLAESEGVRGLRVLSLKDNQIGNAGAEALASSRSLARLLELDLENTGIGDAGAVALAESPFLDGLLRLVVRGSRLGDEARAALTDRFGDRVTV